MKRFLQSQIIATGLAVFSMFFGAGNLMYPLNIGLIAGQKTLIAIMGFIVTGVILPLLALISIILFNGDYKAFFNRLGSTVGSYFIFFCMLIIGPFVAMPRIVTLSHVMIAPFIGNMSLFIFTALFLFLTFLGTYKESRIINLLGYIISPLLLISLAAIIIQGLSFESAPTHTAASTMHLILESLKIGYKTLDMIGAIFFSSIVITLLRKSLPGSDNNKNSKLAIMSVKSGTIGVSLLALIYFGMGFLGSFHGKGLEMLNEGELFSALSFRILDAYGAIIIALAVLMACYSTIVALAAVLSEYIRYSVFKNTISFRTALFLTLLITGIISNFGLGTILSVSSPYIDAGYPALIALVLCNLAYKLFGFKPVKLPVLITLIVSCIRTFYH